MSTIGSGFDEMAAESPRDVSVVLLPGEESQQGWWEDRQLVLVSCGLDHAENRTLRICLELPGPSKRWRSVFVLLDSPQFHQHRQKPSALTPLACLLQGSEVLHPPH